MTTYLITNRAPAGMVSSPDAFAAWSSWFDELGDHLVDRGNPAFAQSAVGNCRPDTVLGGYTLIQADDLAAAVELAHSHPLVTSGGGVEVGELTVINAGRELAEDRWRPARTEAERRMPTMTDTDDERTLQVDAPSLDRHRMKVTLGNHLAVIAPAAERDAIGSFYRDVLGWTITRATEQKDDFRVGDNFYVAFVYADETLDAAGFRKAMYLELKAHDVDAMRHAIVASAATVLDVPDPHLYFQAPGGQVWRLVGVDEDLSKYEGNDDLDASVEFVRHQD